MIKGWITAIFTHDKLYSSISKQIGSKIQTKIIIKSILKIIVYTVTSNQTWFMLSLHLWKICLSKFRTAFDFVEKNQCSRKLF